MGEIGFPRHEFLYELRWWEVKAIIRGYERRRRDLWSVTRWQTFRLMEAQIGTDALHKAGIRKMTDLILFPWEKEQPDISAEEISELQAEMARINALNNSNQNG